MDKMRFIETPLPGAWVIEPIAYEDERGHNVRAFCKKTMEAYGITTQVVQCNSVGSAKAGTLRGMHFQRHPYEEAKLVRCVRGALYDVVIDLRPDSPTYQRYYGVELTADNMKMIFVPKGFAHGLLTLKDDTEVYYMVSEYYTPGYEGGIRFDDPAIGIQWPGEVKVISEKDRSWPLLEGVAQ
jgi:dTDP-4-dehydrorhamnose 3,5-epimerase